MRKVLAVALVLLAATAAGQTPVNVVEHNLSASRPLPAQISNGSAFIIPVLDTTLTARFPVGSTPADNESNAVTITRSGAFVFTFDGSTWDRWTGAVTASSWPLPTGASTLAEQQTQTTSLQLIDNLPLAQASATAGQTGPLIQGAVTTSAPTYTTGQTNPLSLDALGSLRTGIFSAAGVQLFDTATRRGWVQLTDGSSNVAATGNSLNVNWIGSTAPTVGQKTMVNSIPVVVASDQTALPAAQSGTWTVQPGNTPNTAPWLMSIHDGTTKAAVLNLAANDPLSVAIVDGSGSQITSFGGGTQYTEADTDASITGTALMWEDAADTLRVASAAKPLPVNVVAGGAGDGAIQDGASPSIEATVLDYTNSNPLAVRLTDTSGDYVGAGAGTQYADGAAVGTPTGTVTLGHDGSNVRALTTDASGDLQVDILTAPTITVTGTVTANAGTGTLAVSGPLTDTQLRATAVPVSGTFWQATQPVSIAAAVTVAQATAANLNATVTDGSGALTVDGTVTANAGTNLNTSALLTTTAHDAAFGTAGAADAQVRTVQGIAGGTAVPVSGTFWQATQPVSGTITANAGSGTFVVGDGTGALNVIVDSITAGDTNIGNVDVLTLPSVTVGTFPDNEPFNLAQVAGATVATGNGTAAGSVRVALASDGTGQLSTVTTVGTVTNLTNLPNEGQQTAGNSISVTPDTENDPVGAVGAAPPGEYVAIAGVGSGATGGFLYQPTVCDTFVNVNVSTATTTLLVTGVSGRHVRICSLSLVTAAANNVALISGTGATCGTGTTGMTGGTTAATGWNFAANGGLTQGSGIGAINQTNATGDSVCVVTSAATQLSGRLSYAIW